MASLIKREGSPYWFAAFDVVLPEGTVRRLKKSTKRKKRSEAMTEAIRIEEAERKMTTSTSEGASRAFAILTDAAQSAARGELSEGRARELIARMCEASTGTPLKFYTVRSWAADWLEMKAATTKSATMARYKSSVKLFLLWLGEKADSTLEAVTKSEIRAFRAAVKSGWSNGQQPKRKPVKDAPSPRTAKTTNHYASDVAGMFRSAVREGLLLASPAAALDRLPEHDSTEREVFTVAEVGQLVVAAGEPAWQDAVFSDRSKGDEARYQRRIDWPGLILTLFYAGPRLGDGARLKEGNLSLREKKLSFMPAKTERKRKKLEVPLHPRLAAWFEDRKLSGNPEAPLFPGLCKTSVSGNAGLSSQFIAIMDAAAVDRGTIRKGTGGQRAQHARSAHSLRHSLTSVLANLDVPEEIRRRIVGHESAEVHAGYTHHERETLARALEKMPSI
ncbi:MAG: hypothetical protein ABI162_01660 [Luteolibacter sp.]